MNVHSYASARQSVGYLEQAGINLSKSLGRLSSGLKVANSGDDAGGLAVSSKLNSILSRSVVLGENVQNGLSLLETQDAAHERLGAILTRMSELRQKFDDPIRNANDGSLYNLEFKELQTEIHSLSKKKFNGISLFSTESDAKSNLTLNTAADGHSSSSVITRNAFFKALMETGSTGGPVGATFSTQALFGSYNGTLTPTFGSTPLQSLNAAGGSVANQVINGVRGTATNQIVNGVVGGTTASQIVKGSRGTTPNQTVNGVVGGTAANEVVNGVRGTTPNQTVNGATGGTTSNQTVNGLQGTTPNQIVKGAQGATPASTVAATGSPVGKSVKWNLAHGPSRTYQRSDPKLGPDGMIYAGGGRTTGGTNGPMYRIDPETGAILQTYLDNGLGTRPSSAAFSPAGDRVYFGGKDNKLHAFNITSGAQVWETVDLGNDVDGTPAVDSAGTIYVGTDARTVRAIDPATGNVNWTSATLAREVNSEPILSADESTLYVWARRIYSLDASTGTINWQSPNLSGFGGLQYSGLAVSPVDGSIVAGGSSNRVRAFNPNGSNKWNFNTGGDINHKPVVAADGTVYVGSLDGNLYAINGATGTEKWRFALGAMNMSAPTIGNDGTIYASSRAGTVFALRDDGTSATQLWFQNTGGMQVESDLLVDDVTGTVFVGTGDNATVGGNRLIAIQNQYARPANLTNVGAGYDPAETAPTVTISGGHAGDLAGTATINADGTLNVNFSGNPSGTGNITVNVANGVMRNPADISGIGSAYDGATPESAPTVTILGADKGTLAGTATVKADGTIDVAFTGSPSGTGDLTVAIANGVLRSPANLAGVGSGYDGVTPEAAPAVTITGADKGTLAGIAAVNADGTLNVSFSGVPAGTGNLTVSIADGIDKPPANLSGIGSGYDGVTPEAAPAVTITGADKGTLSGTATVNADGTLDIAFSGNPSDVGNLTVGIADGVTRKPSDLSGIGSGYDGVTPEAAPVVTITGADRGTLAGTASVNADGTLDLNFTGAPAGTGNLTVSIADGIDKPPSNLSGVGSGYDGVTPEAAPAVIITGADKGTLAGTATVNANGTLDIAFSGNPSDVGNLTVTVADGVPQRPPNLSGIGSGYDGVTPEAAPVVTVTGADKGTLAGTASVNADGTLDLNFTGAPIGTGNLTVSVADGLDKAPANLTGIGSGYDGTTPEAAPLVTITGADKGTLAGTASVNSDGTLDIAFSGNPSDVGNLTVSISDGTIRKPSDLSGIGSGYDGVTPEPNPTVTISGADKGTLAGNASVNADGTLDISFTGAPTGIGDLTVTIANGLAGVSNKSGIGSGYTPGDPAPVVTITGADKGTLTGATSINPDGTIDLNFSGFASGNGNLNVQVADGTPHVANLTGVGSGFLPTEPAPVVNVTGANKGTVSGVATVRPDGALDIALSGNPTDSNSLSIDANGVLRVPPTVTNVGTNHDPSGPAPIVTITGADKGTLVGVASVNPDTSVDVSFAGAPTGSGTLNVQVAGSSSVDPISQVNLLDLNGDLWDYSVAEFEAFTELLADGRAQNGAEQNSLGVDWNRISTQIGQLEAARGRITDADFAAEMTNLGKAKILSESSATLLAKHNRITTEALLTLQRLG